MSKVPNRGREFEKEIKETLKYYEDLGLALMDIMPVPTSRPRFSKEFKCLVCVPTGKAPFDVYGYLSINATFVGAELKASQRKASLRIRSPKEKGEGLQCHQLDALYNLSKHGGIVRIVWNNDGEIGVIGNQEIESIWHAFAQALASEQSGKKIQAGTKSIKWSMFTQIEDINSWLLYKGKL